MQIVSEVLLSCSKPRAVLVEFAPTVHTGGTGKLSNLPTFFEVTGHTYLNQTLEIISLVGQFPARRSPAPHRRAIIFPGGERSSAGRASVCGTEGRGFKSHRSPQNPSANRTFRSEPFQALQKLFTLVECRRRLLRPLPECQKTLCTRSSMP